MAEPLVTGRVTVLASEQIPPGDGKNCAASVKATEPNPAGPATRNVTVTVTESPGIVAKDPAERKSRWFPAPSAEKVQSDGFVGETDAVPEAGAPLIVPLNVAVVRVQPVGKSAARTPVNPGEGSGVIWT